MYEYLTSPDNLKNLSIAVMALIFGASARTMRVLKSTEMNVKTSLTEWIYNQATALPVGIIALLVIPSRMSSVNAQEMLAVMLGIGLFCTEAWSVIKSKIEALGNSKKSEDK